MKLSKKSMHFPLCSTHCVPCLSKLAQTVFSCGHLQTPSSPNSMHCFRNFWILNSNTWNPSYFMNLNAIPEKGMDKRSLHFGLYLDSCFPFFAFEGKWQLQWIEHLRPRKSPTLENPDSLLHCCSSRARGCVYKHCTCSLSSSVTWHTFPWNTNTNTNT